jgi:hypothetical protein
MESVVRMEVDVSVGLLGLMPCGLVSLSEDGSSRLIRNIYVYVKVHEALQP